MTLKEKLKAALKLAGLGEGLAEIITIESEDEIKEVIDQLKPTEENDLDFNQVIASDAFSTFVAKHGFDAVLKASKTLQSEHDKKVTAGIKSFKEKYFKKIEGEEEPEEGQGKSKEKMEDEAPQWAKTMMAKMEAMEKKEQHSTKADQVRDLISKSKLSKSLQEKWLGRVDVESEVSFEDQIKALETEEEEYRAELLGASAGRGLPSGGGAGNKPSDKEIEEVVDNLF